MPKVRMVARISGVRNGVDWPERGGVIDVPADEAADLIRAGLAVEADVAPEKAVAPVLDVETAAAPKPRTRKA